jgi:hypothetical protein
MDAEISAMAQGKTRGRLTIAPVRAGPGWFSVVPGRPGQPILDRTLAGLYGQATQLADEMGKDLLFDAIGSGMLSIEAQLKVRDAIAARADVEAAEKKAAPLLDEAIAAVMAAGVSTRDAAVMLGLSHQRVHQLYQKQQHRKG